MGFFLEVFFVGPFFLEGVGSLDSGPFEQEPIKSNGPFVQIFNGPPSFLKNCCLFWGVNHEPFAKPLGF